MSMSIEQRLFQLLGIEENTRQQPKMQNIRKYVLQEIEKIERTIVGPEAGSSGQLHPTGPAPTEPDLADLDPAQPILFERKI